MTRANKHRVFARLGMLAVGVGALAALCCLYLCPARVLRPMPPPPAAPVLGASEPEASEQGVSAAQVLLADASERLGTAAPPESAALLTEAEKAVRAVLPGERPVFARYGVPGVGITLLDEHTALVSGIAALESGKRLAYRVRVLFLPGGYREAMWPELRETEQACGAAPGGPETKGESAGKMSTGP